MMRSLGVVLFLLLGTMAAADDKPKDKQPTPKSRFDALVEEFEAVEQGLSKAQEAASSDEERGKLSEAAEPKLERVLVRFVELAQKYPRDPVAVDAVTQVIGYHNQSEAKSTSSKKLLDLLTRYHVTSDRLGPLCEMLTRDYNKQSDVLLRAVLAKNPSKSIQAEACLALAQNFQQRALIARSLAEKPASAGRYEERYGKEITDALKKADAAGLAKESSDLLGLLAVKYVKVIKAESLNGILQHLGYWGDEGSKALLRALLHHEATEVRGWAYLALGVRLKLESEASQYKDARQTARLRRESEALFTRAVKDFADVRIPGKGDGTTVGAKARAELYDLQYLAVGKAAPEVEGEDQDGKKFALSDYKGKVVLLDFWKQF